MINNIAGVKLFDTNEFLKNYVKNPENKDVKFLKLDTRNMVHFLIDGKKYMFPNSSKVTINNTFLKFENYSIDKDKKTFTIYGEHNSCEFPFSTLGLFLDKDFLKSISNYLNTPKKNKDTTDNLTDFEISENVLIPKKFLESLNSKPKVNKLDLNKSWFENLGLLNLDYIKDYYPDIKDFSNIDWYDLDFEGGTLLFTIDEVIYELPILNEKSLLNLTQSLGVVDYVDDDFYLYFKTKSGENFKISLFEISNLSNKNFYDRIKFILDNN